MSRLRGLLGGCANSDAAPAVAAHDSHQLTALLRDYEKSGLGWFWSSDAEGRVTYVSQCVADALNVPCAELIGRPLISLFNLEPDEDEAREVNQRSLPLIR